MAAARPPGRQHQGLDVNVAFPPDVALSPRTSPRLGDPGAEEQTYHGQRRRSSMLVQPLLTAINESEEDVFDQTLRFDLVALGGGVASGYWAEALAGSLGERALTAAIVSAYPEGLAPYERPALSKDCLNPGAPESRDFTSADGSFPFTGAASEGGSRGAQWYRDNGIQVLYGCMAVRADLDAKYLVVRRVRPDGQGGSAYGDTVKVCFGKLMIATGARAARIADTSLANPAKGLHAACFCSAHEDVEEEGGKLSLSEPDRYAFGSVHHLRDLGDALKLTTAMQAPEFDGQETCRDPVVIVGGSWLACEVAGALITHCPGLSIMMVMPGDGVYDSIRGFGKAMRQFYEKQLVRAGVKLAKGYYCHRLWGLEEAGDFLTLEGTAAALRRTMPRHWGPVDKHYSMCRGVVAQHQESGDEVWLPARFVVVAVGAVANTELFRAVLRLHEEDRRLLVDDTLRTSHASGDVFAAGDVASCSVPLAGGGEPSGMHVQHARESARHVAEQMLNPNACPAYDPVPHMYSRWLDLSWRFYGVMEGQPVELGIEQYPATRAWGAFWLRDNRVVGAFLEGGSPEDDAVLRRMARDQPRVVSRRQLQEAALQELLADPAMLTPPELGVGEFHAETDPAHVLEVLKKHETIGRQVKTSALQSIMAELGADWDDMELADATAAMDPESTGVVAFDQFQSWWAH